MELFVKKKKTCKHVLRDNALINYDPIYIKFVYSQKIET